MLNKETIYYLKVDNAQDTYETTIMDEEVNDDFIHAMIKVRDGIFTDIELTRIDPKEMKVNNDYYIIGSNDVNFQKTTIIESPHIDPERDCITFRGKVFGDPKLHSKGVVNFFLPMGFDDMLIYTLKLIGRHIND